MRSVLRLGSVEIELGYFNLETIQGERPDGQAFLDVVAYRPSNSDMPCAST